MPRASRVKAKTHASAVQLLHKRTFAVPPSQVEALPPSTNAVHTKYNSGTDHSARSLVKPKSSETPDYSRLCPFVLPSSLLILPDMPLSIAVPPLLPAHPYSRSHLRREKRKSKQELSGGNLSTIAQALSDAFEPSHDEGRGTTAGRGRSGDGPKSVMLIGEGKARGLSEKAKRKQIVIETKRLPAVMRHPVFKGDPWATIREHARNTIEVKQVPGSKRR